MDINHILSSLHYYIYHFCGRDKHWRNHQNFGLQYSWQETEADNEKVRSLIESNQPFFIGRYGTIELGAFLKGYRLYKRHDNNLINVVKSIAFSEPECWKLGTGNKSLQTNAGVFPLCEDTLQRFTDTYLKATKQLDVLASWITEEIWLEKYDIIRQPEKIDYNILEFAYRLDKPWTMALKGKKVLVVSPFADDIKAQYQSEKRHKLFANKNFLKDFDLETVTSVNSAGGGQYNVLQRLVPGIRINEIPNRSDRFRYCSFRLRGLRIPIGCLHKKLRETSNHRLWRSPDLLWRLWGKNSKLA